MPEATAGAEVEGEATEGEEGESEDPGALEGVVVTRTPVPTATTSDPGTRLPGGTPG